MFDEELLKVYRLERSKLIDSIRSKGIVDDNVLNAVNSIPRELFIHKELEYRAYDDKALGIDCRQTISQPYTVAYMTQLLDVKPNDKVLEIGTGSGYQTTILKFLGAYVYTIESINDLFKSVSSFFEFYDIEVNQKCGDGSLGWIDESPFDKIMVTAGAPEIPAQLLEQLSVGGRLVIPVGDKKAQTMMSVDRISDANYEHKSYSKFRFVPLIGKNAWKK